MTEQQIVISARTLELWGAVAAKRDDGWELVLASVTQTDDALQASAREISC